MLFWKIKLNDFSNCHIPEIEKKKRRAFLFCKKNSWAIAKREGRINWITFLVNESSESRNKSNFDSMKKKKEISGEKKSKFTLRGRIASINTFVQFNGFQFPSWYWQMSGEKFFLSVFYFFLHITCFCPFRSGEKKNPEFLWAEKKSIRDCQGKMKNIRGITFVLWNKRYFIF